MSSSSIPTISVKLRTKLDDPRANVKVEKYVRTSLGSHQLLGTNRKEVASPSSTKATIFQQASTNNISKTASLRVFHAIQGGTQKKNPRQLRSNFMRLVRSVWHATKDQQFQDELLGIEWKAITRGGKKTIDRSRFHSWWISTVTGWGGGMDYAEVLHNSSPVVVLERLIRYFEMLVDTILNENDNMLRSLADIIKSPLTSMEDIYEQNRSPIQRNSPFPHFDELSIIAPMSPSRASTPSTPLRKINTAPTASIHGNLNETSSPQYSTCFVHDMSLSNSIPATYTSPPNQHITRLMEMRKEKLLLDDFSMNSSSTASSSSSSSSSSSPQRASSAKFAKRQRKKQTNINNIYNLAPTSTQLSRQQNQRLHVIERVRRRPSLSESLRMFDPDVQPWPNNDDRLVGQEMQRSDVTSAAARGANNNRTFDSAKNEFWKNMNGVHQQEQTHTSPKVPCYNVRRCKKSTIDLKAPRHYQKIQRSREMKSPATPFRSSKQTSPIKSKGIMGDKLVYDCEQWWEHPNAHLSPFKSNSTNNARNIIPTPRNTPTTSYARLGTAAMTTTSHNNNSRSSPSLQRSLQQRQKKSVYEVDSLSSIQQLGLHNISSDPRDINYWSEVSILRKRRELHSKRMNQILEAQHQSEANREAQLLKEVNILEDDARETLGHDQYAQLRLEIAQPSLESTVAELLTSESPIRLLEAAERSQKKSTDLKRKNENLRQRLKAMYPGL